MKIWRSRGKYLSVLCEIEKNKPEVPWRAMYGRSTFAAFVRSIPIAQWISSSESISQEEHD